MTIKHLVISGGGPSLIQTLGALQYLEKNKFIDLNNIETIYGTSAGAIIGTMICMKYDWETINDYVIKRPWHDVFKMNVEDIRTVLLGQDPYYANEHQAHGLSFSVPEYIKIPPSLKNIFKEIELEFPERKYNFINGNLTKWFQDENIFLLNCSLTVKKSKPNSHMNIWKKFTDDVIKFINEKNKNCVYLLLGNFAHNKIKLINEDQHKMVINAVHPSPLSA